MQVLQSLSGRINPALSPKYRGGLAPLLNISREDSPDASSRRF